MNSKDGYLIPERKEAGLFLRRLPNDVRAKFKAKCALHNRTMTGMITAFIRDSVKDPDEAVINFSKLCRAYPNELRRKRVW